MPVSDAGLARPSICATSATAADQRCMLINGAGASRLPISGVGVTPLAISGTSVERLPNRFALWRTDS